MFPNAQNNPAGAIPVYPVAGPGGVAPVVGSHVYGYDGSGNLITDTWTIGGAVYVQTFGYTSGNLTTASDWVKQ